MSASKERFSHTSYSAQTVFEYKCRGRWPSGLYLVNAGYVVLFLR